MSIENPFAGYRIKVAGLLVEVVRKDIKNLHLGVYPPSGRIRVAAPLMMSDEAIRLAVVSKLGWIKRHQARFQQQPRQSHRRMVSGESHYFMVRRYRLRVIEHDGPPHVSFRGKASMDLFVRPGSSEEQCAHALASFYRTQLKSQIPELLEKWQPIIGVQVAAWGIKKMKTKWGTCNADARRVWLNLELAKKPAQCLEYILVHELVHVLERQHNDRFRHLMDTFMPQWRIYRDELASSMLAHERWTY